MEDYISWYPGHIAKAEHNFRDKWLPLLDIIIELVDARVPVSGRYYDRQIFRNKPVLTVYTKGDLCDLKKYKKKDSIIIDARTNGEWRKRLINSIKKTAEPVYEKLKNQGRKRNIRLGVCGLPNTGKSTFLNSMIKSQKKAKTGNLPGVTKQMQFATGKDFDILDSPGICPIKIPMKDAYKLIACKLLPDKLLDPMLIAENLAEYINQPVPINETEAHLLIKQFRAGQFQKCLDTTTDT